MTKKPSASDPHAAREAAKYENPIPSREYILDLLRASAGPLTHDELCATLQLTDAESVEALRRRLAAMERDGQLVQNRRGGYGTLDKMNLTKGRVVGHPEGFGFVVADAGGQDIFLSSRQMRRVFDGDEVLVRIAGLDRRGRPEGSIVEVVEHRTQQLVGRFFAEGGIQFVRPDNPRVSQDVLVAPEDAGSAGRGQMVVVTITRQPSRENLPAGRVVRVLGDHLAPGIEIDTAIFNAGIPFLWSPEVVAEVAAIADEVQEADKAHRVDLRHLPFVTIDGEDAKDFDDAVYCAPVKGGYLLSVAIADVSHYVKLGTALDLEAYQRGNSVYFPGQVVPMLPEKLSNGLCSLKPDVDRLCLVAEMRINDAGQVTGFCFFEGVFRSHARLTYTQVAAIIAQRDDAKSGVRKQFHRLVPHLDNLYELYLTLRKARDLRGAIDFETGETRILFNAERKIEQIIPSERTDAHRLIEECMLCANVCAADLLAASKLPALYRVHAGPRTEKLADLREFLGELGLGLPGGDNPSPLDYQAVLKKILDRPDAAIIQSVMLRSMSQAMYQPENRGHFGLHYPAYAHFTSPIRRYPDLLVHRAIRGLLHSKKRIGHLRRVADAASQTLDVTYPYDVAAMIAAGSHCSLTERRADEATRNVVNWLKCEYLLDRVGDEFAGVVTSVTGFGLFVELQDLYIDGLVHITGLPKDYYFHEAAHHRLVGERTRRVFRLGDRLRVRVSRVDIDERKIDFDLVEAPVNKARRGVREGGRTPELKLSKRRKVLENERPRSGKPAIGKSGSGRGGSAAAFDKAFPDTVKAVNSGNTKSSEKPEKSSKSDKSAAPARARGNKNAGRRRR